MSVNYTPDQKEYKEYKGFGTFKMFVLQNFPFIAEDFDALTYYQMLCKIVEYLKDVIENNKAIQDNQTGLLDAYNQLQSFVNNYFDNLDVQNEVNAKLDIMATDGTLDRIINENIYEDIKNRMTTLETNVNTNINELNAEKDDIKEYIFKTPYMPASRNIKQTTPKYVNYNPINKELTIIQKNHNGYLKYVFNTKNGDTSDASVGLAWDLIRLKKVLFCPHAYVFKNDYESIIGNLSVLSAPVVTAGRFERDMSVNNNFPLSANDVFYKNKESVGVYGLASADGTTPSEVNYKLDYNKSGKANILFYCSSASSKNVDIIVNGKVIANLDLSSFVVNGFNCFYTYNFDIQQMEIPDSRKEINVTVKNNDTTRIMYFCCMNYMELKDYDGRDYDSFKATSSEKYYINHNGASDYAIYDTDLNKFMGSYHGGESALQQQFTLPTNASYFGNANFSLENLPDTEKSFITPFFEILQRTSLNNKGTMISMFDFNSDGQLLMNFNFDGNVNTDRFFTALTCNSKDLDIVKFPDNKLLSDGENALIPNNGMITFTSNSASRLRMDILYSKFYDEYISDARKNGYVLVNNTYNKFYYGAVMGTSSPVNVKHLNFQKILDFYAY